LTEASRVNGYRARPIRSAKLGVGDLIDTDPKVVELEHLHMGA